MPTAKLSDPMRRVLFDLSNGHHAGWSCRTMSDHGGVSHVIRALVKRGLIDWHHEITEAGRAVVRSWDDPPPPPA